MAKLSKQPTAIAEWYELIKEAQSINGQRYGDDLEGYLAFLLLRYLNKPELFSSMLGLEYLQTSEQHGVLKREQLRDIGDKCLLFSGLFPNLAERRRVSISYFVELGRTAYSGVAAEAEKEQNLAKLYDELVMHFVGLMDVLHIIREMNGENELSVIKAFELWEQTGSQYAKEVVARSSDGFFVPNKKIIGGRN